MTDNGKQKSCSGQERERERGKGNVEEKSNNAHLEELLLEILLVEFSEFPAQVPITPDHKFPSHHGTPDHRSKDQKIIRSQVALAPDHIIYE